MKILITDALSENGLNLLREAEFEVIYKINPLKDELTSLVSDIDGWIVRSGTKILKEILFQLQNILWLCSWHYLEI